MFRDGLWWFTSIYQTFSGHPNPQRCHSFPQFPAVAPESHPLWPCSHDHQLRVKPFQFWGQRVLRTTNKRLLKSPEVSIFGLVLRENLQENMAFLPSNLSVPAIFPFCQSNDSSTSGISTVQKLRRGPQVKTHILPDSRHSRITVQF